MSQGFAVPVGTVISVNGGTSGGLTSSYTPGNIIKCRGIGSVKLALTTTKGGATDERVRIMDYTDASNPRQIPSNDWNDPQTPASAEHVYTSSTKTVLSTNLGGVVEAIAIEAKTSGGVPTSSDTVLGVLTMFDGAAR